MGHIAGLGADAAAEMEKTVAMNILAGKKRKREEDEKVLNILTSAIEKSA